MERRVTLHSNKVSTDRLCGEFLLCPRAGFVKEGEAMLFKHLKIGEIDVCSWISAENEYHMVDF